MNELVWVKEEEQEKELKNRIAKFDRQQFLKDCGVE